MTSRAALPAITLLALVVAGCGDGTERIRISGAVTFQGKPVPYGNITFEPDLSKGNRGPQGYAMIRDGRYDTNLAGTGPCPGPQQVRVEGFPEFGTPNAKKNRLVIEYRTTLDLPRQATTYDFDVPASAGRREAISDLPPP